ncbi:MAG: hypothetical protein J0I79_33080 [Mesorhizobium sp.]|uniref:hypothetical protein n=1 Tax=Mesorhizobium sp. TaxID=1871066 RepID=UPI001AC166B3|nr:hypothetical protein [Mesorhizobium sp.]MBN9222791.1 hypothetical protein [Mesorhizobium sp.]
MRKYVVAFFSLCIDAAWISVVIVLANRLGLAEMLLGQPLSGAACALIITLLLTVARLTNTSLGEWLLAYALDEKPASQRQWPNLVLGTLGFVSGLLSLLHQTAPDYGMPFLFMVEQTPLKIATATLYACLYCLCGMMLLRFAPRAKLYNALLCVSTLPLALINIMFSYDALIGSMMARAESAGRSFPLEKAQVYARVSVYYTILMIVVVLAILYFCRERPIVSTGPSIKGPQGNPA